MLGHSTLRTIVQTSAQTFATLNPLFICHSLKVSLPSSHPIFPGAWPSFSLGQDLESLGIPYSACGFWKRVLSFSGGYGLRPGCPRAHGVHTQVRKRQTAPTARRPPLGPPRPRRPLAGHRASKPPGSAVAAATFTLSVWPREPGACVEARRCQDGFGGAPQPPRLLTQSLPVANGLQVPSFCRRSFPGLSATAPQQAAELRQAPRAYLRGR